MESPRGDVARISRKELKADRFAREVGHSLEYVETHRRQLLRYGLVAVLVLAVALGAYFFRRQRQTQRRAQLSQVVQMQLAPIARAGDPSSFPTEQAKSQALEKALAELIARHPGSEEATIARYLQAARAAEQGKLAEAEKLYVQVAASGQERFAPLARLALAEIQFAQGRPAEGEKALRALMERPSAFVSRDLAAFALARHLGRSKPEEARKLLESMASEPSASAVSRTAVALMGELLNP
ncbi:MAG: tetratricopeptide repeat protein [Acidobacteria bacterium]|nr:tetratricopeptide repeat protein [Acidobacteriota bacterium]